MRDLYNSGPANWETGAFFIHPGLQPRTQDMDRHEETEELNYREEITIAHRTVGTRPRDGRQVSETVHSALVVPAPNPGHYLTPAYDSVGRRDREDHPPQAAQIEEFLWGLDIRTPGRRGFNELAAKNRTQAKELREAKAEKAQALRDLATAVNDRASLYAYVRLLEAKLKDEGVRMTPTLKRERPAIPIQGK